jgi:rhamnosyltransferase
MQHVFIIGSRGLPAQYGGFETFVDELVSHQQPGDHFEYRGADCFVIKVPKIGSARVIAYDILAINAALKYCKKEQIAAPIFYILGNTAGGFIGHYANKIHRYGGKVFVNPDGLEWKRTKWGGACTCIS